MGQLDTSTARLSGLLADDGTVPRLSVLLIDGDRLRAEALLRQLGPMAHFRIAATIGEAAQADAQHPAHLILASDDLPQTSLRAFTALWRRASAHPHTPVIGVGIGTSLLDEACAQRCGVLAWLPRDAGVALLRARLAMMLSLLQRPAHGGPRTDVASASMPLTSEVSTAPTAAGELPDPMPSDALLAQLRHEVARARRVQQPMALLWVRIDHLARHAAQHGAEAARACQDALGVQLRRIARRASDVQLRHGEDGHVLLLTDVTQEGARLLARCIVAHAASGLIPCRPPTARPLTVSLGTGFWQPAGHADDRGLALLTTATIALHMARRQGRNCSRLLHVPGRADAALVAPAAAPPAPYGHASWQGPVWCDARAADGAVRADAELTPDLRVLEPAGGRSGA